MIMPNDEAYIKEHQEEVFRLGLAELARRKLEHVSYNMAVTRLHNGTMSQDDFDFLADMFDASPHRIEVLPSQQAIAVRSLQRRFGIWKYLPSGTQRVECPELAIRIADGEFDQIAFIFSVPNPGYAPLQLTFNDVGIDYVFEEIARMLAAGDEPGRDMEVEHHDGNLYIFVGQHPPSPPGVPKRQVYTDECPNCDVGSMYTDEYRQGQREGDFTIDLTCSVCSTTVTINVEEGDEELE